MIITNFYFKSPSYNFDKSFETDSQTDKTSFRPNAQLVREQLSGRVKLKHLYDYPDGDFKDKPDYSMLHSFPDRTEINSIVKTLECDIERKKELDKTNLDNEKLLNLDKTFKEKVIDSLSNPKVDSTSIASDS